MPVYMAMFLALDIRSSDPFCRPLQTVTASQTTEALRPGDWPISLSVTTTAMLRRLLDTCTMTPTTAARLEVGVAAAMEMEVRARETRSV